MLNRIVFTEKNQIATLKVVDELRHVDIKPAMHALEKRISSSNSEKVNLDLNNLQVISHDTQELLGLVIRHVRLQNIPITISGSSQIDPGILLSISEGSPQLLEQQQKEKVPFRIQPKYFSRFEAPFFSSDNDSPVFKRVIPDNYNPEKHDVAKHFLNDNEELEIKIIPSLADNYIYLIHNKQKILVDPHTAVAIGVVIKMSLKVHII